MTIINFADFKANLESYLDCVENNQETLLVKRKIGEGTVILSLDEYNAMIETMHLLGSRKNANRLYESIQQMKSGDTVSQGLLED